MLGPVLGCYELPELLGGPFFVCHSLVCPQCKLTCQCQILSSRFLPHGISAFEITKKQKATEGVKMQQVCAYSAVVKARWISDGKCNVMPPGCKNVPSDRDVKMAVCDIV